MEAILSEPTTTAPLKRKPCEWCGGSRDDQVSTSYYAMDHSALCTHCWEVEYNDGEAADAQS